MTPTPEATATPASSPPDTPVPVPTVEPAPAIATPVEGDKTQTSLTPEPTLEPTATYTPLPTATRVPPAPGQPVWTFRTDRWIDARPLVDDGAVYVGSQDGSLYALDLNSGNVRWEYVAGAGIVAHAAVSQDLVFVGDVTGRIHAVSKESGDRIWIVTGSGEIWGSVATNGPHVFVARDDGTVVALDAADGSRHWELQTGGSIYGGTTVDNDAVYFASHDDWVYAVDSETGTVRWRAELLLGSNSTPVIAEGLVLVGSWDGRVYALDQQTGALVWNFWTGGSVVDSVTVTSDSVLLGSDDGFVYSLSLTEGTLLWRQRIGDQVRSTPAVSDGLVYIASAESVYALDERTGATVWQFSTRGTVAAPIAVGGGRVLAGSHDNVLYALQPGAPPDFGAPELETRQSPQFPLLSPRELREQLNSSFGSQQPVLSHAHIFSSDGQRVEFRNRSDLVVEIFENGYFLLTGRTVQEDGWEVRFLSRDDYNALADERGQPELKRAVGWCCVRTDIGLALMLRGDRPLDSSTATTAHEAGHALQRLLNPVQSKAPRHSLAGAMREAQAYTFEVAMARKIGEYAGVETARFPSGYSYAQFLDAWRAALRASTEDLTREHELGQLIMWLAVLHDPELAHLRQELDADGHVSADSLLDMYYHFVALTPSEVGPYVRSITPDILGDDLNFIFGTVGKRIGSRVEFPGLVLNVPTLVVTP